MARESHSVACHPHVYPHLATVLTATGRTSAANQRTSLAHAGHFLHFTMSQEMPTNCSYPGGAKTQCMVPWPTRVHPLRSISIGSSVLAQLMDRRTDHATSVAAGRIFVFSTSHRSRIQILWIFFNSWILLDFKNAPSNFILKFSTLILTEKLQSHFFTVTETLDSDKYVWRHCQCGQNAVI